MDQDKTRKYLIEEAQKRHESNHMFSMAFYSSPCLMAITRVEDGLILDVNDTFVEVTGYGRDELVGRSTLDLGLWEQPGERSSFIERVKGTGVVYGQEVRLSSKSGAIHNILLSGSYNLTLGNEEHTITMATDITERKQIEDERVALLSELAAALGRVKTLSGILPICSQCKKIRDNTNEWHSLEEYIRDRSDADFTHGICPECEDELYPDLKE
jgi:PAS domain S-box-containing protein